MSSRSGENTRRLLRELNELLADFSRLIEEDEDVRQRVLALVPSYAKIRDLGKSLLPADSGAARDRILEYLRKYAGQVIDGDELMVVSGIGEWARRVRELRVQFGWRIFSGNTVRDAAAEDQSVLQDLQALIRADPTALRPSQYVLLSTEPDRDAAYRWNTLNEIRKERIGVKGKILKYLLSNIGTAVTGEELRYLANERSEWARRVRELRTEDGWAVVSRQSGRPDLPVGHYILETSDQAEPHDRKIPDVVRVAVLQRDTYTCQRCSWNRDAAHPDDRARYLELHHMIHHRHGGPNEADNLITLCNYCHDQVHRNDGDPLS